MSKQISTERGMKIVERLDRANAAVAKTIGELMTVTDVSGLWEASRQIRTMSERIQAWASAGSPATPAPAGKEE